MLTNPGIHHIDPDQRVQGAVLAVKLARGREETHEAIQAANQAFAREVSPETVADAALQILAHASLRPTEIRQMKDHFDRSVTQLPPTHAERLLRAGAVVAERFIVSMPEPSPSSPPKNRSGKPAEILPFSSARRFFDGPGIFYLN